MSAFRVWYIQPPSHTKRIFHPDHYQAMLDRFDVVVNEEERNFSAEEVAAGIGEFDAIVTGWGAPSLTDEIFNAADKLKIVAHSAGSIKHMVSREQIDRFMIPRNITLFSANVAIAYNVAESTVGMLLMTMHRWPEFSTYFKRTGNWHAPDVRDNGRYLSGSTLGIVSASSVAREVIHLLRPWPLEILVYDPYLTSEMAAKLGVEKVELNDLFQRSDHISLHLPNLPQTQGMIGQEQLALMKPGATLINTSRGGVLDHDALIEKCKTDEIYVCLDVTDPEPLPHYSEFRMLDNVCITPHVSGTGFYGYFKIGEQTFNALCDCSGNQPVTGAVDFSRYELLA